jgi:hypothetical protein
MSRCIPSRISTSTFQQFGSITGCVGATGSSVVVLPIKYSSCDYFVTAVCESTNPTFRMSAIPSDVDTFTIYWSNTGLTSPPLIKWFACGS